LKQVYTMMHGQKNIELINEYARYEHKSNVAVGFTTVNIMF